VLWRQTIRQRMKITRSMSPQPERARRPHLHQVFKVVTQSWLEGTQRPHIALPKLGAQLTGLFRQRACVRVPTRLQSASRIRGIAAAQADFFGLIGILGLVRVVVSCCMCNCLMATNAAVITAVAVCRLLLKHGRCRDHPFAKVRRLPETCALVSIFQRAWKYHRCPQV
jgi:Flp pilus assembly protein TadB